MGEIQKLKELLKEAKSNAAAMLNKGHEQLLKTIKNEAKLDGSFPIPVNSNANRCPRATRNPLRSPLDANDSPPKPTRFPTLRGKIANAKLAESESDQLDDEFFGESDV